MTAARRLLKFLGVVAVMFAAIGWLVSLPSPAWYAAHAALFDQIALILVWIGGTAQTLFVLIWATQPWFREWMTRAIMTKSLGIMLLLDLSLFGYYVTYAAAQLVGLIVIMFVTLGALLQVVALIYETWRARHDDS